MIIKNNRIEDEVLKLMIEQGGLFNRKLAELYYVADSENSKKLEDAFSDIFTNFLNRIKNTY